MQSTSGDVYVEDSPELAPGTILGSYRIIESLGSGTMGWVYVAEHTRLERRVAIKVLHQDLLRNAVAVKRFFDEARAANRIDHENIVEVTDFVEDPEKNVVYIIMELLKGTNLSTLISLKGILPIHKVAHIGAQIASALHAAHEAGIIHRDLKSANIFLADRANQEEFVKVLDFGVAKLAEARVPDLDNFEMDDSAAGMIVGTPAYMSPEQALAKEVDQRTDIYSLGVILFESATGQRPFLADNFGEYVMQHATLPPPKPSDVVPKDVQLPWVLEDLILRCLEKKPSKRPATMEEVWKILEALSESQLRESFILPPSTSPPSRRRRWWLAAAVGVVILGGTAAGVVVSQRGVATEAAQQSTGSAGDDSLENRAIVTTPVESQSDANVDTGDAEENDIATHRRLTRGRSKRLRRPTDQTASADAGSQSSSDAPESRSRRGVIDPFEELSPPSAPMPFPDR